ncbi:MAG: hypothetical protein ACTMUB_07090 [cyanobacterium endosymbiont of Rhopalodia musculus]|uniref:hypothetical protein n=1 Tax=cyanobacterium endosymbiont of Epithemia clementina EcSB TaxID=3034674 RepID=UPI002481860F|nr:hypothetical protein [cyanobacterium endosymbiont of Epithemia clementina EcSB]WGT68421.1 hypothetical protein P3F56_01905 [cyanobacterium endosymbiont of Epithemia clementina EcSB]
MEEYFKTSCKAKIMGEITGVCQLIIQWNREILGFHFLGFQAEELIGIIALAINRKIPIQDLAHLFPPSLSISAILSKKVHQWKDKKSQKTNFLCKLSEKLSWLF